MPAVEASAWRPFRVQREELLDTRTRLCGYRFAAIVEDSGKETPWAGKNFGRILAEDGLRRITERRLAIVPVIVQALDPDCVAEIATPNTVLSVDAGELAAGGLAGFCGAAERVRSTGVKIAVDGLPNLGLLPELSGVVDWLVFDLRSAPLLTLEKLMRDERIRTKCLAVRGVESWGERDAFHAMGFGYFMGPFLAGDVKTDSDGEIDPRRLRITDLLNKLRADVGLGEIAASLKLDPGLIVRLLTYANSPAAGLAQKVSTVEQAVMVLGRERLYRLLTALLFSAGKDDEAGRSMLEKALARGRFMELMGEEQLSKPQCDELFLAGVLTYLEPLLGVPIRRILERLVVADDVERLLLRNEGPYSAYLMLALAIDRPTSIARLTDQVAASCEQVNARQLAAVEWAVAAMQGT
jgi:EAL and modified HD-GYP domain-containing signal transduction protein